MLKNHKKQEGESERAKQLHYQVYNQWFSYTHLQLNTREKKKKFSFHLAEGRKFFHCENMATSCLRLHPQKCTMCRQLCSRHACKHTHLGVCFGFCVLCGWLNGGFLPICRLAVKETASRRRKTGCRLLSVCLNRWKEDLVYAKSILALTQTNAGKVGRLFLFIFWLSFSCINLI